MSSKIYTVAILGCGSRGADTYGKRVFNRPGEFRITDLCEISPIRLKETQERFSISDEHSFTDENVFFEKKRADVIFICTQDKDHVRQCLKALELGYDVLQTEKFSSVTF